MAENEVVALVVSQEKRNKLIAWREANPEIDLSITRIDFHNMAMGAIHEGLLDILVTIVGNSKTHKDMPAVKMLMEMAAQLTAGKFLPPEEYQSVAEVLWKAFQALQEEQGTV